MKTIGRFLMILLVACLVGGGIYWLVQANPSLLGLQDGRQDMGGDRLRGQGFKGLASNDDRLEIRSDRDDDGGGGEHQNQPGDLDARAISSILRNVIIIALTVIAVLAIQKIIATIRQRRQAKAAQGPES